MFVVVVGIIVIVHEVPAVDVVDVPVVVIIDSIIGDFVGIVPNVRREIFVFVFDARVDDSHDNVAATRVDIPGLRRIDIGIHDASGLARVVHCP